MKQTVCFDMFVQAFEDFRRSGQFSFEALNVIFNYLEDSDPACELDIIGICCEFSESTVDEIISENDLDKSEDPEENLQTARSFLEENTSIVGETADGFVYLQF
jgi:hypothetical protein